MAQRLIWQSAAVALLVASATATSAAPDYGVVVDIALSPRAAAYLTAHDERMVVMVNYWGDPVPEKMALNTPEGGIGIGTEEVTVPFAGRVAVSGDKVIAERVPWVESIQVLINVSSARRSAKDNLLACGIFEGSLARARRKPIPIRCRLLSEEFPGVE